MYYADCVHYKPLYKAESSSPAALAHAIGEKEREQH